MDEHTEYISCIKDGVTGACRDIKDKHARELITEIRTIIDNMTGGKTDFVTVDDLNKVITDFNNIISELDNSYATDNELADKIAELEVILNTLDKAVSELETNKAELTNNEQTITAGELKIDDGNIWGSDNGLSIHTPKSLSLNSDNELTMHSDEFVYIDSETYINGVLRAKKKLSVSGDTTMTGNLSVSGDTTMTGNLSVTGKVTVPTPSESEDATPKSYIDNLLNPTPIYPQVNDSKFEAAIECIQLGKIVLVKVADLKVTSSFTHGDIIATGFPSPSVDNLIFVLTGAKGNEGSSIRVIILDGNLEIHYDEESNDTAYDKSYCGVFWYLV